ncbi:hypothetical protein M885DRAFT_339701 [Pelagophyceae sp. CCMP2097]|nr:hypothetical protein M885DRAFT_339701 [Pelagophyceae sp. CCMP2097]
MGPHHEKTYAIYLGARPGGGAGWVAAAATAPAGRGDRTVASPRSRTVALASTVSVASVASRSVRDDEAALDELLARPAFQAALKSEAAARQPAGGQARGGSKGAPERGGLLDAAAFSSMVRQELGVQLTARELGAAMALCDDGRRAPGDDGRRAPGVAAAASFADFVQKMRRRRRQQDIAPLHAREAAADKVKAAAAVSLESHSPAPGAMVAGPRTQGRLAAGDETAVGRRQRALAAKKKRTDAERAAHNRFLSAAGVALPRALPVKNGAFHFPDGEPPVPARGAASTAGDKAPATGFKLLDRLQTRNFHGAGEARDSAGSGGVAPSPPPSRQRTAPSPRTAPMPRTAPTPRKVTPPRTAPSPQSQRPRTSEAAAAPVADAGTRRASPPSKLSAPDAASPDVDFAWGRFAESLASAFASAPTAWRSSFLLLDAGATELAYINFARLLRNGRGHADVSGLGISKDFVDDEQLRTLWRKCAHGSAAGAPLEALVVTPVSEPPETTIRERRLWDRVTILPRPCVPLGTAAYTSPRHLRRRGARSSRRLR